LRTLAGTHSIWANTTQRYTETHRGTRAHIITHKYTEAYKSTHPVPQHGINLVDKDDAGRVLARDCEEHLDHFRTVITPLGHLEEVRRAVLAVMVVMIVVVVMVVVVVVMVVVVVGIVAR
jgi:hypothetical protein